MCDILIERDASTKEELPVMNAATNFVTATARFPTSAVNTTFLGLEESGMSYARAEADGRTDSARAHLPPFSPYLPHVYCR